ncbi:hypothetical protein DESACE_06400 [Desulfurella acetivorans A63]|nr:hypothetical protein DESACE_06400 [Desulfurella acetivorans A63]
MYFALNGTQIIKPNANGLPNCGSNANIQLLQQILSEHPKEIENAYGFDPTKPYNIGGVCIYKKGSKTLKKSYCRALIYYSDNSTNSANFDKNTDVYYVLQSSVNGNNTEISVLNPYSM